MALIHEKLYQSDDLAKIDFAEYIRSLASYLFRSYRTQMGAITLQIDADNVFMGVDTAVPCGLILNELVSNSLKHAFPDGRTGEIRIEVSKNGGQQLTLRVADNGVGLPADLDVEHTSTLGMHLVNTLVDQLDGTVEFNGTGGTEFRITFAATELGGEPLS
jgi:two-component sensor histidine kinase